MFTKMLANLGQECLKTVKAAGIFAVWRRLPITTVTITLVIGFWLYHYVSVSSAATTFISAPRPSVAVVNEPPIAIQPLPESQPTNPQNEARKKIRRTHHAKSARSAFRRKQVGQNEVDYVASDVTIRLFTPGTAPTQVAHSTKRRRFGKQGMTQAAERSPLVSK
jgi:hypothetical protein